MPIEDAADEGRDQVGTGLGGRRRLRQREDERQIDVDGFLLKDRGGLNTLPGRGDLDEHALAGNAALVDNRR